MSLKNNINNVMCVIFHLPTTCLPRFCVSYGYLLAWEYFSVFFVKVLQGFKDHMKFFPPPLPETVLNKYCISGNFHC